MRFVLMYEALPGSTDDKSDYCVTCRLINYTKAGMLSGGKVLYEGGYDGLFLSSFVIIFSSSLHFHWTISESLR